MELRLYTQLPSCGCRYACSPSPLPASQTGTTRYLLREGLVDSKYKIENAKESEKTRGVEQQPQRRKGKRDLSEGHPCPQLAKYLSVLP